ncbi:hypothetical protein PR202_gb06189 [Eleusine coracana subsp. coracana]|uniref:Uncharacterized protein n=1 Tax=Eleusine coracana subsp. coracana TaxID=191504 RepID=A0AAV5E8T3_ELECO|nr:hypothetical protein PR202_gb06189 [Eleusine coracana subsp. coracana]
MWRLRIAEGRGDPDVEAARRRFTERRHHLKHSADLLMRLQLQPPGCGVRDGRGAARHCPGFPCTLCVAYAPEEAAGLDNGCFIAMIIVLYVSGALNTVLSAEHQKEIRRYLYNHQARSSKNCQLYND